MDFVSVWGSTYRSNLDRIVTLQEKVVRIVSKVSCDSHTKNLLKELNILRFQLSDIFFSNWKTYVSLY